MADRDGRVKPQLRDMTGKDSPRFQWHYLPSEGMIPEHSYIAGFESKENAEWYGRQKGWME